LTIQTRPELRPSSDRSPHRDPYDLDMAKRELMGIQELRLHLKAVVEKVTSGTHVVFTRHGKTTAALVPMDWYREAAEKMGEPTDL
jgi:prevent-host-death family protein